MAAIRKCSHCGCNGHNSRTCPERGGVKLFGVRISSACTSSTSMRKSASTGNLIETTSIPSPFTAVRQDGYASEGLLHTSRLQRKKGVPWTEEEHKLFLIALQKLGKGDWRGISKHFVKTRTPTQVASHAQKHFLRQSNLSKRRRRSSLFDMAPDVVPVNAVQETHQESNAFACESEAVKDISSTMEVLLADEVEALSTFTAQGSSDANHGLSRRTGMHCNDCSQQLYSSAYMHYWDPTLFCYYTWPRTQGFPNGHQLPNTESKVVRPLPVTPTTRGEIGASLVVPKLSNCTACLTNEHTLLSPALSRDESRRSAFHMLTGANNEEVNNQGSICNAISVA
ncbi:hypothetical protein L7F22_062407 [Adiantum nelumboides]|nr:hypothetical protein [Adiantum nelumboides]